MEHGMTQQAQAKKRAPRLEVTNPNAAGIDIGSASHYVAVPADRDDEPVREFKSFTVDVHKLADWLEACGVDTRVRHQNADFAFLVRPLPCESTTYAHFCGSFVVATA